MENTVKVLIEIRKKNKISQREIAKGIQKSTRDISLIENRQQALSFEVACKWVAYLAKKSAISGEDWEHIVSTWFSDIIGAFSKEISMEFKATPISEAGRKVDMEMTLPSGKHILLEYKIVNTAELKKIHDKQKNEIINAIKVIPPSKYDKILSVIQSK